MKKRNTKWFYSHRYLRSSVWTEHATTELNIRVLMSWHLLISLAALKIIIPLQIMWVLIGICLMTYYTTIIKRSLTESEIIYRLYPMNKNLLSIIHWLKSIEEINQIHIAINPKL